MADIQKKLKKNIAKIEKKRLIRRTIIIILVAVIFLIITFFASNTISFAFNEEMNIILTPKDKSIIIQYNEPYEANFEFVNDNFFWCNSECIYRLKDISENKTIDENIVYLEHDEQIEVNYTLKSDKVGSGQKIYIFEVECNNLRSLLCRTEGEKKIESSFVTLNYDLSEEEKTVKAKINKQLVMALEQLKKLDEFNIQNKQLMYRIDVDSDETTKLKKQQDFIDNELVEIFDIYNSLKLLWDKQRYVELDYIFTNLDDLSMIRKKIMQQRENIFHFIDHYNKIIENMSNILDDERINNIALFNDSINQVYKDIFFTYIKISDNKLDNYALELPDIDKYYDDYVEKANNKIIRVRYELLKYRFLLDALESESYDAEINDTLEYDEDIDYIKEMNSTCKHISKTIDSIETFNFYNRDTNITEQQSIFIKNMIITNFHEKISEDMGEKINRILELENLTKGNITEQRFDLVIDIIELYSLDCNLSRRNILKEIPKIDKINKTLVDVESEISTALPENLPECCVFSKCEPCCTPQTCGDNPRLYPVVFLHGHSFNKEEKPEASLNAFSSIQHKLVDEGFINAGEVDISKSLEETEYGYWGRSGYPVSVRATYYIIRYYDLGLYSLSAQKSDRIENYAIRLKEIIDYVKFKTGYDKVKIVTHSMGGLVAREYISIFGDDSVDKLVLIASPNQGISPRMERLCKFTGADPECEDMTEGSIFLKRLNSVKEPENVEIHTIIAQGCETNDNEGDGVVSVDSAELSYADNHYIEGNCTDYLGIELHNKILDPELYPEVYDIIVGVLNE